MEMRVVDGVDRIFKHEPAERAYELFLKYKVKSTDESSCLNISILDAFMTGVIDSFSPECFNNASYN